MSDQFYTPPPFKACNEPHCYDGHYPELASEDGDVNWVMCQTCHGTGLIPIYYTVQQWEALTGRKVPDDIGVYALHNSDSANWWQLYQYGSVKMSNWLIVITTEAGRPPNGWRPE